MTDVNSRPQNQTRINSATIENPNDLISRGNQAGNFQREKMIEFYKAHYDSMMETKAKDFIRRRRNARILGLGITVFVVGVYAYTIQRVGREKFLDDNEPLQKKTQV